MEQGNSAAATTQGISVSHALSIVLPVTLVTIAGLIVLVGVLVYLLVRKQKIPKKKDVQHPRAQADDGYTLLGRSQQLLSNEHNVTATAVEGNRYTEVIVCIFPYSSVCYHSIVTQAYDKTI